MQFFRGPECGWSEDRPSDPVALGLCRQTELDLEVQKAAKKSAADGVMTDDERRKLVSTEQSLGMPDEPRLPSGIAGLENFSSADLKQDAEEEDHNKHADFSDADSFFNLPEDEDDDEDEDDNRA